MSIKPRSSYRVLREQISLSGVIDVSKDKENKNLKQQSVIYNPQNKIKQAQKEAAEQLKVLNEIIISSQMQLKLNPSFNQLDANTFKQVNQFVVSSKSLVDYVQKQYNKMKGCIQELELHYISSLQQAESRYTNILNELNEYKFKENMEQSTNSYKDHQSIIKQKQRLENDYNSLKQQLESKHQQYLQEKDKYDAAAVTVRGLENRVQEQISHILKLQQDYKNEQKKSSQFQSEIEKLKNQLRIANIVSQTASQSRVPSPECCHIMGDQTDKNYFTIEKVDQKASILTFPIIKENNNQEKEVIVQNDEKPPIKVYPRIRPSEPTMRSSISLSESQNDDNQQKEETNPEKQNMENDNQLLKQSLTDQYSSKSEQYQIILTQKQCSSHKSSPVEDKQASQNNKENDSVSSQKSDAKNNIENEKNSEQYNQYTEISNLENQQVNKEHLLDKLNSNEIDEPHKQQEYKIIANNNQNILDKASSLENQSVSNQQSVDEIKESNQQSSNSSKSSASDTFSQENSKARNSSSQNNILDNQSSSKCQTDECNYKIQQIEHQQEEQNNFKDIQSHEDNLLNQLTNNVEQVGSNKEYQQISQESAQLNSLSVENQSSSQKSTVDENINISEKIIEQKSMNEESNKQSNDFDTQKPQEDNILAAYENIIKPDNEISNESKEKSTSSSNNSSSSNSISEKNTNNHICDHTELRDNRQTNKVNNQEKQNVDSDSWDKSLTSDKEDRSISYRQQPQDQEQLYSSNQSLNSDSFDSSTQSQQNNSNSPEQELNRFKIIANDNKSNNPSHSLISYADNNLQPECTNQNLEVSNSHRSTCVSSVQQNVTESFSDYIPTDDEKTNPNEITLDSVHSSPDTQSHNSSRLDDALNLYETIQVGATQQ